MFDDFDTQIQCEEFYEEPFEFSDDFYEDESMDDYDWQLWLRRQDMKPLAEQVKEIKSSLADIGCKAMWGKTCKNLVKDIVNAAVAQLAGGE